MTRQERAKMNKEMKAKSLQGKGLYLYKNNSRGTITLTKLAKDGRRDVKPGDTWEGDDYFMFLVRETPQDVIVLKVLERENTMPEEKLILDQPDQVTSEGTVEHVVKNPEQDINETFPQQSPKKDVLINENPLDGVEIILND